MGAFLVSPSLTINLTAFKGITLCTILASHCVCYVSTVIAYILIAVFQAYVLMLEILRLYIMVKLLILGHVMLHEMTSLPSMFSKCTKRNYNMPLHRAKSLTFKN